jgi:putative peptide zinc metalloprotease protein
MAAIPTLKEGIRISPYREAGAAQRFLLELDNRHFLITAKSRALIEALLTAPATPDQLERQYLQRSGAALPADELIALAAATLPAALFSDAAPAARGNPFTISIDLLSPWYAGLLTGRLAWLFKPSLAWSLVAIFAVLHGCVLPAAMHAAHEGWSGSGGTRLVALLLLSGLIHELGHTTACRYFNCPHGAIGFGLYVIFPAWYADVSKAWRLQRRQRAVVDLGGVYFQALMLIGVDLYALASGSPDALKLIWLVTFTMLFTLNPVFKFDGYWLLSDLSGLHNLHLQVRQASAEMLMPLFGRARPGARSPVLYAYGLLSGAYMLYFASFLVTEVRRLARTLPDALADSLQQLGAAAGAARLADAGWSAWRLLGDLLWPLVIASACVMLAMKTLRALAGLRSAVVHARFAA